MVRCVIHPSDATIANMLYCYIQIQLEPLKDIFSYSIFYNQYVLQYFSSTSDSVILMAIELTSINKFHHQRTLMVGWARMEIPPPRRGSTPSECNNFNLYDCHD